MMSRDTMREFGAVPIVLGLLGLLFVVLLAADAGVWAWVVLGVLILAALLVILLLVMRRPAHPAVSGEPVRPVGAPEPPADGVHRVLVVADAACTPAVLGEAVAGERKGAPTEAFVVAPALGSRTARWTSDDHAYADAESHLAATIDALAGAGIPARGHIGSHDPHQATEDGLREFPADEIVFVVHPAGETNWLEDGVVEAARARYPIPVRALDVGPG
jgi:hypothetical protein